jgi:excisionase family DNA binding protein
MEKLLTVRELADKLRVAPASIYHWLGAGRLPCIRFSARCVRFRESDIAKLVDGLGSGSADSETPRMRDLSLKNETRRKRENGSFD